MIASPDRQSAGCTQSPGTPPRVSASNVTSPRGSTLSTRASNCPRASIPGRAPLLELTMARMARGGALPRRLSRDLRSRFEQTRRTRGISLRQMVKELTTYLRGWIGYFGTAKRPRRCNALKRGYAADFGRWCGSNVSRDERDFANFANGRGQRPGGASCQESPRPVAHRKLARSGHHFAECLLSPARTPAYGCAVSLIRRTAGCGPACPVVWQGRRGDPSPYAD